MEEPKAQCALSMLRNLLRDEEATTRLLVENQAGGENTREYHFPIWERVMDAAELVREGRGRVGGDLQPEGAGGA